MDNQELNEKIARLIGWWTRIHEGHEYWELDNASFNGPPNFLDPKRLGELMDLADKVLDGWNLWSHRGGRAYSVGLRESGMGRRNTGFGITSSLAIARAIVAYT